MMFNHLTEISFLGILSPAFGEYFAFISINKEAMNKIQIDSRSKNDALSSDKIFLFRKLTLPNSVIAEFAFLWNPFLWSIPVSKQE